MINITQVLNLKRQNLYLDKFTRESYTYVTNLPDLIDAISLKLSQQKILGVDIECSNKSYEGFVCLIQFAYYDEEFKKMHNYVFDMIQIFSDDISYREKQDIYNDFLGEMIFENKDIIKIFHGSLGSWNGDVGWLQRDYGINVQNIFDTQEFYKQIYYSD